MRDTLGRNLRLLGAALLIAITLYLVDPVQVWKRLTLLRAGWALAGLALSVPLQMVLSLRWMHIARCIGAPLGFLSALRAYYLAGFVNQALPTGLAGAALRAMQHSGMRRADGAPVGMAAAATAVILDRLAGLAMLCAFGLVGAIVLGVAHPMAGLLGGVSVAAMVAMGCTALWLAGRHGGFGNELVASARLALWRGRAFGWQSALSAVSVLLLSATFYCAGRAADVDLSFARTILLAPLVLGAMAIPLAIAGWGLREAAAAALFAALGLDPATGVAVSVAFGVITLVASAPGLVMWLAPGDPNNSQTLRLSRGGGQRPVVDTEQGPP